MIFTKEVDEEIGGATLLVTGVGSCHARFFLLNTPLPISLPPFFFHIRSYAAFFGKNPLEGGTFPRP